MAVADVFDALISRRVYKDAMTLRRGAPTSWSASAASTSTPTCSTSSSPVSTSSAPSLSRYPDDAARLGRRACLIVATRMRRRASRHDRARAAAQPHGAAHRADLRAGGARCGFSDLTGCWARWCKRSDLAGAGRCTQGVGLRRPPPRSCSTCRGAPWFREDLRARRQARVTAVSAARTHLQWQPWLVVVALAIVVFTGSGLALRLPAAPGSTCSDRSKPWRSCAPIRSASWLRGHAWRRPASCAGASCGPASTVAGVHGGERRSARSAHGARWCELRKAFGESCGPGSRQECRDRGDRRGRRFNDVALSARGGASRSGERGRSSTPASTASAARRPGHWMDVVAPLVGGGTLG